MGYGELAEEEDESDYWDNELKSDKDSTSNSKGFYMKNDMNASQKVVCVDRSKPFASDYNPMLKVSSYNPE